LILSDGFGGIEERFYTSVRIFCLYMDGSTSADANI